MKWLLDRAPWHCWAQGHGWIRCLRGSNGAR